MAKLLNKLAPFTSAKLAVINWLIESMPTSTRLIVYQRSIAKHLPMMCIGYKPYQRNPRKV